MNPVITWRSEARFTLWDDCMCFPDLLVKVRRHASVTLAFTGEQGRRLGGERRPRAESELLQHELDHLDGVLATDRALDARSLIYRAAFAGIRPISEAQVDYVIQPTL